MGGVQFSTLYLAQTLDRSWWHSIVVCPREGDLTVACRDAGIDTRVVAYPRLWSTSVRIGRDARVPNLFAWLWNAFVVMRSTRLVRNRLRELAPEVIVTKGLTSHFIGGFAGRGLGLPCVWHVQDLISERSFGVYRRIFNFAASRLPQQIIVDGAAIKEQLPPSIHSRIAVVHNGVDTNIFRPGLDGSAVRGEFEISPEQVVIGHAARLTPWKGQHYLIEAFAQIADQYPNAVLLFAGSPVFDHDAYEQRLQAMAIEFGLLDRIKFAGYRHDLQNVVAAMDIFAFTSIEKDTSPLALLSAMASGLPIVAFDIEGVRELTAPDQQRFLSVPVGDTKLLAESLRSLIIDQSLRSRLAHNVRRAAETEFSLTQYVSRIERELTAVCPGRRGAIANAPASVAGENNRAGLPPSSASTSAVSAIGS